MSIRAIKRITGGAVQYDGAGVKLVRVIGRDDAQEFDPFLMLDAFDADNPEDYLKGFPWHPHRGIETVTYLIEGRSSMATAWATPAPSTTVAVSG